MALPTIERNWIFTRAGGASTLNQIISQCQTPLNADGSPYGGYAPPASANQAQRLSPLWYIKDTLINFSSGPWSVVQSRNSSNVWGNSDYWTSTESLYVGTTPPWIVLENTFAGRTAQILIKSDIWNTNGGVFSSIGTSLFPASVGGNPPTIPSDALRWDNTYNYGTGDANVIRGDFYAGKYRLCMMQTWDDIQGVESLRFMINRAGSLYHWGFWDKLKDVPVGGTVWDCPEVALWGPNNNYTPDYPSMSNNNSVHFKYSTTPMGARLSSESNGNTGSPIPFNVYGIPTNMAGGYNFSQLGLVGDASPMRGKLGNLVDFWLSSNRIPTAEYFPAGSPQFCQVGNFIWPWDSTQLPPQST